MRKHLKDQLGDSRVVSVMKESSRGFYKMALFTDDGRVFVLRRRETESPPGPNHIEFRELETVLFSAPLAADPDTT